MFQRPLDKWSDKEKSEWMRTVAGALARGEFEWNAPNIPAASTVDTTLTSASLPILAVIKAGMACNVSPQSDLPSGIIIGGAWSDTDGELTIRLANVTALGVNPGSLTWSFFACIIP